MSTKTAEVSTAKEGSSNTPGTATPGTFVWMAGFFLLGVLMGMLGSLVITWQYHIDAQPKSIGLHFLGMSAGFVLSSLLVPRALARVPVRTLALGSSGLAFLSLVALALLAPPSAAVWRIGTLAVAGIAAGTLTYSVFHANQTMFEIAPATTANHAGVLFVGGGLLATIVVGSTYFGSSIHIQTALLSIVPAIYVVVLLQIQLVPTVSPVIHQREDILRETLKDLRSIAAMLFSLLVFFQFACEWAMVGWLPLYLIHTLGINPVTAVWALGLYFLALMVGRLLAQVLLPIVSHRKMLIISVVGAMFGYLMLSLTNFIAIALAASVIIGFSHAPVFPLIAEKLDDRFSYHPGFYSGMISFAMAGAMATPWLLGYIAEWLGMRFVMLIPAMASVAVFILSILIMLESRLMGSGKLHDSADGLLASDK